MRALGAALALTIACAAPVEDEPGAAASDPLAGAVDGAVDAARGPRCPSEMALVALTTGAVCVDRYEAAVVQVLPDGREQPWPFDPPVDGLVVRAIVKPGIKPQAYISGAQASAAC